VNLQEQGLSGGHMAEPIYEEVGRQLVGATGIGILDDFTARKHLF
jgi:hypothetical protein